mgnify:CR=1 FL=1
MFTGIVEELGALEAIKRDAFNMELTFRAKKILTDVGLGDSIAVNGVCLTVTHFTESNFTVDVMPETFRKTSLGQLQIGSKVNLERALTLQTRLGGHLVSGHIDGVGKIREKRREQNAIVVSIYAPSEIFKYIVPKGSIAIDGISLTVVDHNEDSFWVSIIPHTASLTTLGFKDTGDLVNLEVDVIARYLENLLNYSQEEKKKSKLDWQFLKENGFL